jgi:hypothetical protein
MRMILGIISFVFFTLLACWLSIWVLFIGGLVDIVIGIKANPINILFLSFGILKVILSSITGWLIFILGLTISLFIYDK